MTRLGTLARLAAIGGLWSSAALADPASEATSRLQDSTPPPPVEPAPAPAPVPPTAPAAAAEPGTPSAAAAPVPPAPPPAPAAAPAASKPKLDVAFAGGVALSAAFIDWARPTASGARDGDLRFSVLRLGARARYGQIRLDFEYRIYPIYQFLRNATVGYDVNDDLSFDVGVSRTPFGLLPFASNSWFFGLPYYLGLEDDADFGVRAHWTPGDSDFWLTFYKNSEGSYFGKSLDSARFSYDPVQATAEELAGSGISQARNDRETNTAAARAAHTLRAGSFVGELGVSGRVGFLHNLVTDERSLNWAVAPHALLSYGPLELGVEAITFQYSPNVGAGDDPRLVAMGAFDAPYAVARAGTVLVANLAWKFDVAWGPIEAVRVYVDTGQFFKRDAGFADSRQVVFGSYLLAGPVHFSVDAALGQNHSWVGPDYASALGAGSPGAPWYSWINVNLGFSY